MNKRTFLIIIPHIFLMSMVSADTVRAADLVSVSVDTMRKNLDWFKTADTIQVQPVCGADGKTYLNIEEAEFLGVKRWSSGRCESYERIIGIHPDQMWITEVKLNDMLQTSGFEADGFTNFNNVMMEVYREQDNIFTLKKQDKTSTTDNCLKVWIDFNGNGSFDKEELIVHEEGSDCEKPQVFQLPDYLEIEFTTMMRVFYGTTAEVVESGYIEKGEVEDYSLIVY